MWAVIAVRDSTCEDVGRVEIASMPLGETPRAIPSHPNRACSMGLGKPRQCLWVRLCTRPRRAYWQPRTQREGSLHESFAQNPKADGWER